VGIVSFGLSDIFGSTKVAADVVKTAAEGISEGLDKAWYTKEEASEMFFKLIDRAYDENGVRNITRRWMAWTLTGWVLLAATMCLVAAAFHHGDFIDEVLKIVDGFYIGWAFAAAVAFFFVVQIPRAFGARGDR